MSFVCNLYFCCDHIPWFHFRFMEKNLITQQRHTMRIDNRAWLKSWTTVLWLTSCPPNLSTHNETQKLWNPFLLTTAATISSSFQKDGNLWQWATCSHQEQHTLFTTEDFLLTSVVEFARRREPWRWCCVIFGLTERAVQNQLEFLHYG